MGSSAPFGGFWATNGTCWIPKGGPECLEEISETPIGLAARAEPPSTPFDPPHGPRKALLPLRITC